MQREAQPPGLSKPSIALPEVTLQTLPLLSVDLNDWIGYKVLAKRPDNSYGHGEIRSIPSLNSLVVEFDYPEGSSQTYDDVFGSGRLDVIDDAGPSASDLVPDKGVLVRIPSNITGMAKNCFVEGVVKEVRTETNQFVVQYFSSSGEEQMLLVKRASLRLQTPPWCEELMKAEPTEVYTRSIQATGSSITETPHNSDVSQNTNISNKSSLIGTSIDISEKKKNSYQISNEANKVPTTVCGISVNQPCISTSTASGNVNVTTTGYPFGGDPAEHGIVYQKDLALALFVRGSQNKSSNFRLAMENKSAGKFDDIVYEKQDETWLFQVKHHISEQVISFRELFQMRNTKYDLLKYMETFLSAGVGNKQFFIFTNAKLNQTELMQWFEIEHRKVDRVMDFSNFSNFSGQYLGLVPIKEKLQYLVREFNKEILAALVDLFEPTHLD